MKAVEYAALLRQAAEWFEAHPGVPAPGLTILNVYPDGTDVVRQLGGFEKCPDDYMMVLRKYFGPDKLEGLWLDFNWPREQVCTPRIVGTKRIPERFEPARDEDIVEWECAPMLSTIVPAGELPS